MTEDPPRSTIRIIGSSLAKAAIGLKLVSKPIVALVKSADAPFAGETCSRIHFGGALGARGAPYKKREGRPVQTGRRSRSWVVNRAPRWRLSGIVVFTLFLILSFQQPTNALDLDDSIFQHRNLGIKLDVPEDWQLYRETGYPSMLIIMTHDRASISLSKKWFGPSKTLKGVIQEDRKGLQHLGIEVLQVKHISILGKQGIQSSAKTKDGVTIIEQIYLQHGPRALILTLTCPAGAKSRYAVYLQQVVESLELRVSGSSAPKNSERPNMGSIPDGPILDDGALLGPFSKDSPESTMPEQSSKPNRRDLQPLQTDPGPQPDSGPPPTGPVTRPSGSQTLSKPQKPAIPPDSKPVYPRGAIPSTIDSKSNRPKGKK